MKVGIAGAGGIGSNVADNLVRSGVKELLIVDFDRVAESNLNRQNYFLEQVGELKVDALKDNLKKIDLEVKIETVNRKLAANNITDFLKDCDILVEAFDDKRCKKMFFEQFAGNGKLCVSASGVAGTDIDVIEIRKLKNFYIVGDFITDIEEEQVYASKLRIITGMMSNLILEKSGIYK